MTQPQNSAWVIRKPATQSTGGIVAAQSRLAAEAGAGILRAGGHGRFDPDRRRRPDARDRPAEQEGASGRTSAVGGASVSAGHQ